MSQAIIVLNAGPSSLRFSVHQIVNDDPALVAYGQIAGLGTSPYFTARDRNRGVLAEEDLGPRSGGDGHAEAIAHLLRWVQSEFGTILSIGAIGHRIAHGGQELVEPTLLTQGVIERLDRLVALEPLHLPGNLAAVRAASGLRPDLPQVGCFDTAFHRGRARVTERFGLPHDLWLGGVRRWGFHGLSFTSVVDQLRLVAPELMGGRVIIAHLADGGAACGVRGGRSVDTTAGFSPLDGLGAGTRCGDLDPGVVLFLMRTRSYREVEALLCEGSGLLGVSGVSGDLRELLASEKPRAAEAVEYFVYCAVREIGSLTAALGGLDALVFTAGAGGHWPVIRQRICRAFGWLGVAVDHAANERGRGCVSPAGRSPSVWVIPADEDRVIAAGTWSVVRKSEAKASKRSPSLVEGVN